MKPERSFKLNARFVLLTIGAIALAGNILLATRALKLWPMVVSIFFSFVDIYLALHTILNEFITQTGGLS